jgi:predicted transcriptional regulator
MFSNMFIGALFIMGLLPLKYGVTLLSRKYLQIINTPKPASISEIAGRHLRQDLEIDRHNRSTNKFVTIDKKKREKKVKEVKVNKNAS